MKAKTKTPVKTILLQLTKKDRKVLKEKILSQVKKVLKNNKTDLSDKIEKNVKKSIKKMVKNTAKHRSSAAN
jgi:Ni,Fe-hydrogenase maturation factor